MKKQILFLSNGHGEDLNASLIAQALGKIAPKITVGAMPIVGEGNAYKKLNIPLIGPTQNLPSGGIFYTQKLNLLKDIQAGLISLTWQQIQAVKKYSRNCQLIFAVGDIVPIAIAHLTNCPYITFLVATSSYYEGTLRLPWPTELCLRSSRCQKIWAKDNFTCRDLRGRGFSKAGCAGYPIMDALQPNGQDLQLDKNLPTIALLPGSRPPEALHNLALQLRICEEIVEITPMQFRVALVPSITEADVVKLARQDNWEYQAQGKLSKTKLMVQFYHNAFADILEQSDLVIGMAGTAVEQAVGLGKPVIQIPGGGPQFTYSFAEAQMRLLGTSVRTIGKKPTDIGIFRQAAQEVIKVLEDHSYLLDCIANGKKRIGDRGASVQIALEINQYFKKLDSHNYSLKSH